ncbi:MAG: hypothetical protein E5Y89_18260 [Mesorhizobium sp.]|nr:MAG: hypothetical protein E5Y89_18260 [Mesorhizobium sp.]
MDAAVASKACPPSLAEANKVSSEAQCGKGPIECDQYDNSNGTGGGYYGSTKNLCLEEYRRCYDDVTNLNRSVEAYNRFIQQCKGQNKAIAPLPKGKGGPGGPGNEPDGSSDLNSGLAARLAKAREKDKSSSGQRSEIDEDFNRSMNRGLSNARKRRDEEDRLRRQAEEDALEELKRQNEINQDKIRQQMPAQPAFDLTICDHMETGVTGSGEHYAQCWVRGFESRGFHTSPNGMCDPSTRTVLQGVTYLYCEMTR